MEHCVERWELSAVTRESILEEYQSAGIAVTRILVRKKPNSIVYSVYSTFSNANMAKRATFEFGGWEYDLSYARDIQEKLMSPACLVSAEPDGNASPEPENTNTLSPIIIDSTKRNPTRPDLRSKCR